MGIVLVAAETKEQILRTTWYLASTVVVLNTQGCENADIDIYHPPALQEIQR